MKNIHTEIFVTILILTAITGYSVAHPVKAQDAPKPSVVNATASPSPLPTPIPCSTWTPYNKDIEQVFGTEACNAKRVLRWIDNQANLYGENTQFITVDADRQNNDGSWDRGLMRINSNTFAGYLLRQPKLMHENGLYTWDDMLDVKKNIRMAEIVYTYQGWCAWYAAPPSLCSRNYPGVIEQ